MRQVALSELLVERRERAGSEKIPVYSVSNEFGFVMPEDIFKKTIASANTGNYKVVHPDDFAYNPSRINIGSIALNKTLGMGLVSPMYVVFSISDKTLLDPEYLLYFLKSPHGHFAIKNNTQGGVRFQLKFTNLQRIRIPLPDIAEQKRTVATLKEAEKLAQRRSDAMSKMEELLSANYIKMFGDPVENPNDWKQLPVSELVDSLQGGKNLNSEAAHDDSQLRVLKISAVTSGYFRPSENKPLPMGYKPPESHFVKEGDLLFSRANTSELVGATAYVFVQPQNLLLPDKLWRFVWKESAIVDPLFVWWTLSSQSIREKLSKMATGTGGSMKNITQSKLLSLKIPVPPMDLQREFADFIQTIEIEKSKQKKSANEINQLREALLAKYYNADSAEVIDTEVVPSPIKIFPIQQALGVILQQGFERGEMVLGKVLYLGQEIYKVGLGVSFVAYKFGPWDIAVKNAVNGGASKKNQFFKRKKIGKGAVFASGPNANKLFEPYADATVIKDMNAAMDKLLPLIKFWKSPDIECLATVCKVIQDNKTLDEGVIAQKVSEWKPNKFSADRVQYMVKFILQHGWDKKLIP